MDTRSPVTVAVARFEDLVACGLQALVAEDDNLTLVAATSPLPARAAAGTRAARGDPELRLARQPDRGARAARDHPATRLVVLANRPSPPECNQMLAFGATACLSKETQGRDILNAIHLASRGLHVLPTTAPASSPAEHRAPSSSPRARPTCSSCSSGSRERGDRAGAQRGRRDRPHPRAQHLPQARRQNPPRAGGHAGRHGAPSGTARFRRADRLRGARAASAALRARAARAVRARGAAPRSGPRCRRALAQVVHRPDVEPRSLTRVAADAADEHLVAARCVGGERVDAGPGRRAPRCPARPRGSRALAPATASARVCTFTASEWP